LDRLEDWLKAVSKGVPGFERPFWGMRLARFPAKRKRFAKGNHAKSICWSVLIAKVSNPDRVRGRPLAGLTYAPKHLAFGVLISIVRPEFAGLLAPFCFISEEVSCAFIMTGMPMLT
jgi:hypothetical protein